MKTTDLGKDKKDIMSDADMFAPTQNMEPEEFIGESADWSKDMSQHKKDSKKNDSKKKQVQK